MANPENKQIPYESTQKDIRDAIESVATAIGGIAIPSADHVSYDNSGSGLSATDVQNALDEIVSDIPTVNDGVLTIQQNGTSIGSFSANTASNVTANIKTPTADEKTATDEFTTADGGLLSKCMIDLVPVQSGSGDPSPDNVRPISGHTEVDLYNVGKNLLPMTVEEIKSGNGSGWSGNSKVFSNVTITILTDNYNHVIGLQANGTANANITVFFPAVGDGVLLNGTYKFSGCPSGGASNTYRLDARTDDNMTVLVQETGSGATFTATNQKVIGVLRIQSGTTVNNLVFKPMVVKSTESDSTFEPYLGHLYQVQIGSTVYGGYVDLVSGVMTVDRVRCKLADQTLVRRGTNTSGIYRYAFAPNPAVQVGRYVNVISNALVTKDAYASYERTTENCITPDANGNYINFYASDKQTDTDWMTFATNNDVEIVYPLATPQTIQLTPQQIETLAGQNNLSTPLSGQSIETNGVEYKELFTFADVKEYVDKKIPDAPTTDGTYTLQAVVSGGVPTYSWV